MEEATRFITFTADKRVFLLLVDTNPSDFSVNCFNDLTLKNQKKYHNWFEFNQIAQKISLVNSGFVP